MTTIHFRFGFFNILDNQDLDESARLIKTSYFDLAYAYSGYHGRLKSREKQCSGVRNIVFWCPIDILQSTSLVEVDVVSH